MSNFIASISYRKLVVWFVAGFLIFTYSVTIVSPTEKGYDVQGQHVERQHVQGRHEEIVPLAAGFVEIGVPGRCPIRRHL
jgi:hypothetical protein